MSKSIITNEKRCYVCGNKNNLHYHHIMFGKNRKNADKDGLTVYLCYEHHEGTTGVHGKLGHELDIKLKQIAERNWLEYYDKTIEEWISRYGRSFL